MMYRYNLTNALVFAGIVLLTYPASSQPNIERSIDRILTSPTLKSGFHGAIVQSAKDGRTLYSHLADHVFIPASNNKLLTSGAAMAILGPRFRYDTKVMTAGNVEDGVLNGDIVIVGSGDPTVTANDVSDLAKSVAAAGIRRVTGGVRYDSSLFDAQGLGEAWEWDDEQFYYAAQISALNVDRNVSQVVVKGGIRDGDPVTVVVVPLAEAYRINCTATTGKTSDLKPHISIIRERGKNELTISGTVPPEMATSSEAVTFEKPALLTTSLFAQELQKAGVEINDPSISEVKRPANSTHTVVEHKSAELTDILALMNKPSDNMIAECLLKTVGSVALGKGTGGSSGTGAIAARKWLLSIGFNPAQWKQIDGSGLSRQNVVSPQNIATLLRYWAKSSYFTAVYNSLPVAGVDGTLRTRMRGTPAAGNCHAKTGSVAQVSCLSGYVDTKDGTRLVFSLMFNNQIGSVLPCMDAQNKIVTYLANLDLHHETLSLKSIPKKEPD